ncbi:type II CAAX prenyl endopeptidase Rce1 family protein [Arenimonas sp.]|uniref:CPBP family glutamic-type intramembrane protease n=1 Tax=Arenimonas sp. TaxID=1872635 RepID=UPI0039E33483
MHATVVVTSVREDLKLAAVLGLAAAVAVGLLFPYLMQLLPQAFAKISLPLAIVIPLQCLQAGFFCFLMAFAGLRMSPRTGLDAPWLRAWIQGRPRPAMPWLNSILLGLLAGVAILALAALLDPHLPPPLHALPMPDAFNGLLASFYGSIVEEIMARLFLMTLIVWAVARLTRRPPSSTTVWTAIALAAIAFGAAHLPTAADVWPLDTFVVFRTIVLNTIAALVFGWLYWRRGIEAAMLAHFSADIALHVLAPLAGAAMA